MALMPLKWPSRLYDWQKLQEVTIPHLSSFIPCDLTKVYIYIYTYTKVYMKKGIDWKHYTSTKAHLDTNQQRHLRSIAEVGCLLCPVPYRHLWCSTGSCCGSCLMIRWSIFFQVRIVHTYRSYSNPWKIGDKTNDFPVRAYEYFYSNIFHLYIVINIVAIRTY